MPVSRSARQSGSASRPAPVGAARRPGVVSRWTTFACAQSPTRPLKEFDLFGTWADDCGAAPSPANQYAIFSLTSRGNIELRNDFGPDYDEMLHRIVDAQRLSHFGLALHQLLTSDDQVVLNTVMMKANDRIRVWSPGGSDGTHLGKTGPCPRQTVKKRSG